MQSPVYLRASSIADFFDCPARWQSKHLLKMRLPTSGAALLGTAVHAGTALFDQSKLDGNPLTSDEAAGAVVDTLQKPEFEVDWEDSNPNEAEKLALPLHKLYCEKVAPKQNYTAVEATCEALELTDISLTLTGTVDRVRKTEEGLGIADIKTGKTAVGADGKVRTQAHAAQIGAYEILAQAVTGKEISAPAQIIGLQVAKTDKGRRAGTGEIANARDILLDDGEQPGLLRIASRIIHSGDFYGNPRSPLCSEKYCPAFKSCRWRR
ncbi:MAG: PD-(D/E)XK nuclease family protein [Desulfovibrio sp.]|nr:PD-(D/E)XK nuclease family protein [Desulfovibrio sp.]